MSKLKYRLQKTLDKAEGADQISRSFDLFIMALILINVASIMLETVEEYQTKYGWVFEYIETFSVGIFTLEYLIRLWSCTVLSQYSHPVWGRISYVLSAGAIIDLLAIIPLFLPFIGSMNMMLLRIFRLLRIFKLGRYFVAFQLVIGAVSKRKEELIIVLVMLAVLLIFVSSMMYYIENEAQPEVFTSIPATMWWGVATLTTVGYGDVYPITPLGKILGACIAVIGIGVFALPAGIIASSYESALSERRKETNEKE